MANKIPNKSKELFMMFPMVWNSIFWWPWNIALKSAVKEVKIMYPPIIMITLMDWGG